MSRYAADQNKVVLLHESGTYANTSGNGVWVGQVTDHSVTDSENILVNRYLGTASRNFGELSDGPRDVNGTISYNAQDMRLPFFAIGSVNEGGATNFYHIATPINTNVQQSPFTSGTGQISAPMSFTLEDSKQAPGTGRNFIRTIIGCVPSDVTIRAAQGEKVGVECNYIAQSCSHGSGTTTAVTEVTNVPYHWSDCSLTIGGSVIETATEITINVNNNTVAPHYVNGSRVIKAPAHLNRDITLTAVMDLDGDQADMLYNEYYKNTGSFNAVFDMNRDSATAGSQHTVLTLSGCKIMSADVPSPSEGLNEATFEIMAQTITGSAWDKVQYYNPNL